MENKFWLLAAFCTLAFSTLYLILTWILNLFHVLPIDIYAVSLGLVFLSTIGAVIFFGFYIKSKVAFQKFVLIKLVLISLGIVFILTNLTKYFYNIDDLAGLSAYFCKDSDTAILTSSSICHWKVFSSRLAYNINLWIYPLCLLELAFYMLKKWKISNRHEP